MHGNNLRAEYHQLGDFPFRCTLWNENDGLQSHPCGASCAGRRCVSGTGAGDRVVSELNRFRDCDAGCPVFQGRGRIQTVILDIQLPDAQLITERLRFVQRRPSDPEKSAHVGIVRDRHEIPVTPHAVVRVPAQTVPCQGLPDLVIIIKNVENAFFTAGGTRHKLRSERILLSANRTAITDYPSHIPLPRNSCFDK